MRALPSALPRMIITMKLIKECHLSYDDNIITTIVDLQVFMKRSTIRGTNRLISSIQYLNPSMSSLDHNRPANRVTHEIGDCIHDDYCVCLT